MDTASKRLTLRQLGWVVATELRLYKNAFFLGFETGGATGDQAEDPTTYLNYRWKFVPQPARRPHDHRLQVLARLPRRRDPLPPHHRHGHQRRLREAGDDLLAGSGRAPPGGPVGGVHLQHGDGEGLHPGQRPALRRGDEPGPQLPQPGRRLLRRPHLGRPVAHGRPQPPRAGLWDVPRTPPPPRSCAPSWASSSSGSGRGGRRSLHPRRRRGGLARGEQGAPSLKPLALESRALRREGAYFSLAAAAAYSYPAVFLSLARSSASWRDLAVARWRRI